MLKAHVFLLLISAPIFGQVNIEKYRIDTGSLEKKYHQHINITSSIKRSTSSLYTIGLKYFKPFELINANGFIISKINYGESNGKEYVNDTFYHLRIISSESFWNVMPEAFLQYESNAFALTNQRYLGGLGIRYRYGITTSGTSIINEWYQESKRIGRLNHWRLSQYIKFRFKFNPANQLDSAIYIQPSMSDLSNIRYYSENTYISKMTTTISYHSSLTAKYFSKSRNYSNVELFFSSGLQFKI